MLFDTHSHYDDTQFDTDRAELLNSLKESGVNYVTTIGACMKSSKAAVKLSEEYSFVYATVGVHPSEVENMTEADINTLCQLCENKKVVAIGEIGLDYHYTPFDKDNQIYWFDKQMQLAQKLNMPVIIHEREAFSDTLEVLKKYNGKVRGVVHCFSGSAESAKLLIDMGYMLSFTGVVTFKNAKKAISVVENVPLDKIMLETDCPYMSPEPFRGKRNDSKNLYLIAQKIAQIKGIDYNEVCKTTFDNALKFFKIEG